jgi:hypothetical protein
MKSFDAIPPATLPLRSVLPRLKPETVERLLQRTLAVPVAAWVKARWTEYLRTHGAESDPFTLQAVVVLDHLKWQTGSPTDAAALEQLKDWAARDQIPAR